MIYNELLNRCYELYKKDWCLARDVKAEDVDEEIGVHGECYVSLNEFEDNEFKDEAYIKLLLGENDFKRWQQISKTVPEPNEVGIKVFFDGVHMDTVWVPKKDVDITINSIARLGYDNYNADVKEDWARISSSSKKPVLSFGVERLREPESQTHPVMYRIVLTCFDYGCNPYADCKEVLFADKEAAYTTALKMANEECSSLNGDDGIGAPDVGCFEVDDCANNDYEVRWYSKTPAERQDDCCDIEYITTYNVYPVQYDKADALYKYRGLDIQQGNDGLYRVCKDCAYFGLGDTLQDALMLADDICLECAKDKTCALEAVHKVPLEVLIKYVDLQQKSSGANGLDERVVEDCR